MLLWSGDGRGEPPDLLGERHSWGGGFPVSGCHVPWAPTPWQPVLPSSGKELAGIQPGVVQRGRWGVLEYPSVCPRGQRAGLGAGEGPSSA